MTQVHPGGRPPKLTKAIIATIETVIRTGMPQDEAARCADVHPATLRNWLQRATAATPKKPRDRSPHERLCLELRARMDKAASEGLLRLWSAVLDAGTPRPADRPRTITVSKTTTQTFANGEKSTTTVTETREVPHDWRAAMALVDRRFATLFAATGVQVPDEAPTIDECLAVLERVREAEQAKKLRLVQ